MMITARKARPLKSPGMESVSPATPVFFLFIFLLSVIFSGISPLHASPFTSGPLKSEDFNRTTLTQNPASSFQLLNPERFNMAQSYTMSYSGSSWGSRSTGVYLNSLSYSFSIPLTLTVDIGAYNLFSSSLPEGFPSQETNQPEFILPRISLDYQPTENIHIGLHLINGTDAYKAYGSPYFSTLSPFNRFP
jgi:hypothetical protein